MTPNFFLKLNINFLFVIGIILLVSNYNKLYGLFFIYSGLNNILILREKSNPKIKKDLLKLNSILYLILLCFVLYQYFRNKRLNYIVIIPILCLCMIINLIGYSITKIN